MKHTAEPWEIRYKHTGAVISDEKQNANAMVIFAPSKAPGFDLSCLVDGIYFKARKSGAKRGESPKWLGFFDDDECNAQRIVACVNALAGIENPKEWVAIMKGERPIANAMIDDRHDQKERIKALESAGSDLLQAMNQYSFFLNGYGNGSASLAEVKPR